MTAPVKEEDKEKDKAVAVTAERPYEFREINDQCVLLEMAEKIYTVTNNLQQVPPMVTMRFKPGRTTRLNFDAKNIEDLPGGYARNYDYIMSITSPQSKYKNFLEITPDEVAQLTPSIFISVDYYNKKGALVASKPLIFPQTTDLDSSMFLSQGKREGAGVKSITINHEGIDTATDKIVLIDSTFIFQDFRSIETNRGYDNLFKLGIEEQSGKQKGMLRYINFKFGWSAEKRLSGKLGLGNMQSSVKAELIKYTFDINEDGSIIVKTQHRGQIHTILGNNPWSNLLSDIRTAESDLKKAGGANVDKVKKAVEKRNLEEQKKTTLNNLANKVLIGLIKRMGHNNVGSEAEQANARTAFLRAGLAPPVGASFNVGTNKKSRFTYAATGAKRQDGKAGLMGAGVDPGIYRYHINRSVLYRNAGQALVQDQLSRDGLTMGRDYTNAHMKKIHQMASRKLEAAFTRRIGVGHEVTAALNKGLSYSKHQEILKDVLATVATSQANTAIHRENLKEKTLIRTAKRIIASQLALMRFIGFMKLGKRIASDTGDPEKGEYKGLYFGALTEDQRLDIAAAKGDYDELAVIFDKIGGKAFLTAANSINVKINELPPVGGPGTANDVEAATKVLKQHEIHTKPFVFFGDFLNTILTLPSDKADSGAKRRSLMEYIKESTGTDIEIVMGYTSYDPPFSGTTHRIKNFPIYYIPLSYKKVNDFWTREILAKDRSFYSIEQFIKDLLHKFLDVFFNVCKQESGTSDADPPLVPKFDYVFGKQGGKNILFIYDSKTFLDHNKIKANFGKYVENMKSKIPHFYLGGPDRGIAKKVSLRDIGDPTLKTAVFYKPSPSDTNDAGGTAGSKTGRWAPVVFESEVDCLGNPAFKLGQKFFVDARAFINSDNFRATGYYGIKKITHELTPDSFSTSIYGIMQLDKKSAKAATDKAVALAKKEAKEKKDSKPPPPPLKPPAEDKNLSEAGKKVDAKTNKKIEEEKAQWQLRQRVEWGITTTDVATNKITGYSDIYRYKLENAADVWILKNTDKAVRVSFKYASGAGKSWDSTVPYRGILYKAAAHAGELPDPAYQTGGTLENEGKNALAEIKKKKKTAEAAKEKADAAKKKKAGG